MQTLMTNEKLCNFDGSVMINTINNATNKKHSHGYHNSKLPLRLIRHVLAFSKILLYSSTNGLQIRMVSPCRCHNNNHRHGHFCKMNRIKTCFVKENQIIKFLPTCPIEYYRRLGNHALGKILFQADQRVYKLNFLEILVSTTLCFWARCFNILYVCGAHINIVFLCFFFIILSDFYIDTDASAHTFSKRMLTQYFEILKDVKGWFRQNR